MPRDTLLDVFTDLAATRGEFLVYDDGFRSVSRSYEDVGPRGARAGGAARRRGRPAGRPHHPLGREPARVGGRALGARSSPGIVVVPIDYRSSLDFVRRIRAIVDAKRDPGRRGSCRRRPVPGFTARAASTAPPCGGLRASTGAPTRPMPAVQVVGHRHGRDHLHVGRDGRAEGRRAHAPEHPGEHGAHRAGSAQVPEVRQAVLPAALPQPAAAQPHVRPGDGHLHPADAAGHDGVRPQPQPARHRPADPRRGASRCSCRCRRCSTCCAAHVQHAAPTAAAPAGPGRALGEAVVAAPRRAPAVRHEVLGLRRGRGAARPGSRNLLVAARVRRHPGLRADGNRAGRHREPSVRDAPRVGGQADSRPEGESRGRRRDPRARRQRDAGLLTTRPTRRPRPSRTAGCAQATSARSTSRAGSTCGAARRR